MRSQKLKAGALQLTLCIVVVIALLLMAFMLFTNAHNRLSAGHDLILQTINCSNKAIDYVLLNEIELNDSISVELENDYKTLKVYRDYWGVFERVTSVSKAKNTSVKKMALLGGVPSENDRIALYLQDNNQALVVVGNTMIKGLCYLPQKGVKSGSISGQSYYGTRLIYGNSKTSRRIPQLYEEVLSQLQDLGNLYLKAKSEQFLDITDGGAHQNSFFEPTKFIFSNDEIVLSHVKLTGNIIIQSKAKITIHKSSELKDVILIAPEIEIQNGVKGNFQGFSDENINVGSNVTLDYPSALVLKESETQIKSDSEKSKVSIKSNTTIKGSIVFLGHPKANNYESQIEIQTDSYVFGEVYCNQNIDLKGSVFGSVFTNGFIAKHSGSIYQNHIYNGTINIDELQVKYVGVRLSISKKAVVKWLY